MGGCSQIYENIYLSHVQLMQFCHFMILNNSLCDNDLYFCPCLFSSRELSKLIKYDTSGVSGQKGQRELDKQHVLLANHSNRCRKYKKNFL